MVKLLDLMDEQLAKLAQRIPPNYGTLHGVLDYFSSYLDECHHPKEELIFRKLRSKDPGAMANFDLVTQHQELLGVTRDLAVLLKDVSGDRDFSPLCLKSSIREFVEQHRQHMSMEEAHFFPVAVQKLSPGDWDEIEFNLFDRKDPLFDRSVESYFRALREQVPT